MMCSVYELIQQFPERVSALTKEVTKAVKTLGKPPSSKILNDLNGFLSHLEKMTRSEETATASLLCKPGLAAFLKGEEAPGPAEEVAKLDALIKKLQEERLLVARELVEGGAREGAGVAEVPPPKET